MNKNRATIHYCPVFPWNTPEREEFGMRAIDFQGCEKNRLVSSPVKRPPAGLRRGMRADSSWLECFTHAWTLEAGQKNTDVLQYSECGFQLLSAQGPYCR